MSDASELTKCPKCGGRMEVRDTDSREQVVVRVRRCKICRYAVETEEHVVAVVNSGEVQQPRV